MRKKLREKLLRILDISPDFKEIMFAAIHLEEKREKVRKLLSNIIDADYDDNPSNPALEWVLKNDAIRAFRTILSKRSEQIAGHSVLKYIDDILNSDDIKNIETPSPAFFGEIDHLLKGVMGEAGIYSNKVPAFLKYEGKKAAVLRSADLSRMAKDSEYYMNKYLTGLDNKVIRRRSVHRQKILEYFKATELEWEDWKWHTRHIIRDADTLGKLIKLTDKEYGAIKLARQSRIPFGITPYYVSLMDKNSSREKDYAVRAQVIPSMNYVEKMVEIKNRSEPSMDFMLEKDTSPIEGITRRYPMIAILKPILTCPQICVYCQRNWEMEDVYSTDAVLDAKKLGRAIAWIEETPGINEVLITGGDPFLLANGKIEQLLAKISKIKNIKRIRLGSRTPVTLPQRVTDALVRIINRFHTPGKREIIIVTHFEHTYEITPQSMEAVQKFRRCGIDVYNQLVYTFYNSRKFEASALRQQLRLIGVKSYYTFNTKGKEETDDFRVPIPRLLQEQNEEARLLPGSVRTDEIVFNVPRLGKNYLRSRQNRDIISILPDGSRIYEFHPWEKKLSLMDTYVYRDVPIYNYLKRLKKEGEDISKYKTIWYYY
ncbi:KamA family radical SAM protein [Thermodesulfobacteriota bacterium]